VNHFAHTVNDNN